jgi:hypothetical protein
MSFRKLCVALKFSGSRYVLGPTSFLWHVQRFASASYGGHLSGPTWLPLKACPHVRTRSTHPTKAERERERNCVSVCEGTMGWEIRLEERKRCASIDKDFWLHLNHLTIIRVNLCSKTKKMHQFLKFILFCSSTQLVSEVFPSIIRSLRLYTQH